MQSFLPKTGKIKFASTSKISMFLFCLYATFSRISVMTWSKCRHVKIWPSLLVWGASPNFTLIWSIFGADLIEKIVVTSFTNFAKNISLFVHPPPLDPPPGWFGLWMMNERPKESSRGEERKVGDRLEEGMYPSRIRGSGPLPPYWGGIQFVGVIPPDPGV